MAIEDLGPAELFVAGAIGEPGNRRFYLQVTASGVTHALLAEKQQVAALAEQGLQILDARGISSDETAVEAILSGGLEVIDPGQNGERFRVGDIAIGMSESELLTISVESAEGDDGIQFVIAPEQFRAMARFALDVVSAGRPTCQWCRLPMNPEGHECPARNGHHRH
jgi:uncharacterized repeat protein (TIGR03847 family)